MLIILVMNNMLLKLFITLIEYICGAPEPIYQDTYDEESNDEESNDEESNDYFFYDLETQETQPLYK